MRSTNTQSTALRVRTSQVWRQLRVLCCAILHRQEAFALPRIPLKQSTCCSKSWVISWRGVHITFGQKQFECAFQTRRFAKLANNKKEKPHAIRTKRLFLQQFPIKLQKIKQEKQKCVRKWSEKILRKKPRKLKWKHQLNIEDIKTTISTISAANGYLGYLLKVRLK